MLLWRALRALLFLLDPERVHGLAVRALRVLARPAPARALARLRRPADPSLEVRAFGLRFEHPVGLAAGFDKGEVVAPALLALGFSHVEIGTLTPRPQPGNPPPRLFRLPEHQALVNRMGFNNDGAEACAARLARLGHRRGGVIGLNLGKNKATENARAVEDYRAALEVLHPHADYLVVNISSPNTPGLRALQERGALEGLLGVVCERARAPDVRKPVLLKLAPDLAPEVLDDAVDVALAAGVAGLIATNTTIARPGASAGHPRAGEAGGLSGAPLAPLAIAALRRIHARVRGRVPIVGVGGVMTAEDAYARIRAGASLVQTYTGFIYGGPGFPRRLARELARLLARDGLRSVEEAVGLDA